MTWDDNKEDIDNSRERSHFILATTILDFWQMSISRDTGSGTIKKYDSENMGILLLCALEVEICLR